MKLGVRLFVGAGAAGDRSQSRGFSRVGVWGFLVLGSLVLYSAN